MEFTLVDAAVRLLARDNGPVKGVNADNALVNPTMSNPAFPAGIAATRDNTDWACKQMTFRYYTKRASSKALPKNACLVQGWTLQYLPQSYKLQKPLMPCQFLLRLIEQ
jgi:hypothetical protein